MWVSIYLTGGVLLFCFLILLHLPSDNQRSVSVKNQKHDEEHNIQIKAWNDVFNNKKLRVN